MVNHSLTQMRLPSREVKRKIEDFRFFCSRSSLFIFQIIGTKGRVLQELFGFRLVVKLCVRVSLYQSLFSSDEYLSRRDFIRAVKNRTIFLPFGLLSFHFISLIDWVRSYNPSQHSNTFAGTNVL